MKTFAIDFESSYARGFDIATLGAERYLRDPRCEIYLMSVAGRDFEWVGRPEQFDWGILHGARIIAHNLSWDGLVLARLRSENTLPAQVRFADSGCTANLSCYVGGPRNLAGAARELLGEQLSKDLRTWMKGRTWEDAVAAGRAEQLRDYALRDARAAYRIWERYSESWPDHEQQLARQTMLIGWRGFRVDRDRVEQGIRILEQTRFDAAGLIPWAQDDDSAVLSPRALGEACRAAGITPPPSTAEDDPACEAWEREHGERIPWVRAMRDYRKSNILLEKLKTMRDRTRPTDGCMGFGLKYHGASTGRWAGDAGFSVHNLPRGESYGVDLRGCIIPRPGQVFIICDLAQIEPRCLAWLAGDSALLEQLRSGVPLYEGHARNTMGWKGGDLKREDARLYTLAKARVLSLGFGCGPERFRAMARLLCGLELSERESRDTVAEFRSSNCRITALWNRLQTDCRRATADGTFEIELPSGRRLRYFDVRSAGGWTFRTERGGPVQRFYGGRLVENLTSGTARDVFAEGLLRVERAGIQVLFHCHDEVVCEVPADRAAEAAEELSRLMTEPPEWMPDLPLSAETQVRDRYTK